MSEHGPGDALLSVRDVRKTFGQHRALDGVSIDVRPGEFVAMLGPSGCGKTTLLRTIAGFMMPDAGSVTIAGEDVTHRPPNARPLNTVFQNYALFPQMRVVDNVAYGPRRKGASRTEARERALEALDLVSLQHVADRFPRALSGGQQQRVALARALVNRPKLLLLDEPLSALDLKLRKQVQLELKHLQEKLGIAFVFVTHDQEEAMTMADRIVVMNAGRIEQVGTGYDIYRRPATHFVADFVGEANFIPLRSISGGRFEMPFSGHLLSDPTISGQDAVAMVRPEHVRLLAGPVEGWCSTEAEVVDVIDVGVHLTTLVSAGGIPLVSRSLSDGPRPERGSRVSLGFDPHNVRVLPR